MYRVYINQNGWNKVAEPEGEDKLLQVLDYFDGQDIMVIKQKANENSKALDKIYEIVDKYI